MSDAVTQRDILKMSVEIYTSEPVSNEPEHVRFSEIVSMLRREFTPEAIIEEEPEPKALTPAVPVADSVSEDYIVCLDDGVKVKLLRSHLRALGMTPEEYKKKWGLPKDYPMTAPSYSKKRRDLAKMFKLGQKIS